MEQIKISNEYQIFLGRYLRYGDGKKIAESVGTNAVYVSQILNGKRPAKTFLSQRIVLEAQQLVRAYFKELKKELQENIANERTLEDVNG